GPRERRPRRGPLAVRCAPTTDGGSCLTPSSAAMRPVESSLPVLEVLSPETGPATADPGFSSYY
ncbi:MAG: hypothetical protein L3J97_05255, partial [Thermoplasmata archaeon]|nr:hypothetical protein [Thermoplasmata archaeon]